MKFVTFTNKKKEAELIRDQLIKLCLENGFVYDENNPELVFVIGGDGTFLRAVHEYIDRIDSLKFVGVRCGSLGFFYDFSADELSELIALAKNSGLKENKHRLIECDLGNKKLYAINEIRFENPFHTLVCTVKISDEELEKIHGNGLIVCNELGSSAYNKSLGGALISHDLHLLQLTEVAIIQNNVYRSLGSPLITNENTIFSFEGDFTNTVVGYDHFTCDSNGASKIIVKASNKELTLLNHPNHSYLQAIKRSFIK